MNQTLWQHFSSSPQWPQGQPYRDQTAKEKSARHPPINVDLLVLILRADNLLRLLAPAANRAGALLSQYVWPLSRLSFSFALPTEEAASDKWFG